jgi:hypothetical protein
MYCTGEPCEDDCACSSWTAYHLRQVQDSRNCCTMHAESHDEPTNHTSPRHRGGSEVSVCWPTLQSLVEVASTSLLDNTTLDTDWPHTESIHCIDPQLLEHSALSIAPARSLEMPRLHGRLPIRNAHTTTITGSRRPSERQFDVEVMESAEYHSHWQQRNLRRVRDGMGGELAVVRAPQTETSLPMPDLDPAFASFRVLPRAQVPSSLLTPYPADLVDSTIAEPVECEVPNCGAIFGGKYRRGNRSRHVRTVHAGLTYACSHCDKSYQRTDALLKHQRTRHPGLGMSGAVPRRLSTSL